MTLLVASERHSLSGYIAHINNKEMSCCHNKVCTDAESAERISQSEKVSCQEPALFRARPGPDYRSFIHSTLIFVFT